MPGTAKMRGLANSFDIEQAIPASAKYLAEMKTGFGNLGLAAAAYNAGESRVSRWLSSGGFLPMETESYVFDIMGEPADKFTDTAYAGTVEPLDAKAGLCRRLPQAAGDHVENRGDGLDQCQAMGRAGGRQFPPRCRDQSMAAG